MSGTILLRGTEEEIDDMKDVTEDRARIKNRAFETEVTNEGPEIVISGFDEKNSNIIKDELSDSGLKADIIRVD